MKTLVYFVRHAEPDFSVKDDMTRPLSEKGIADSQRVTRTLDNMQISTIYSSPYKRAIDTIKDFANNQRLEIITNENFRERKVGEWVENFKVFSENQWKNFNFKLTDGECLREVQERNVSALLDVVNSNLGKSIAIATHGTALSTIINYFDLSFGHDEFWSIIDKMPYIVCFRFDGIDFESLEVIELL